MSFQKLVGDRLTINHQHLFESLNKWLDQGFIYTGTYNLLHVCWLRELSVLLSLFLEEEYSYSAIFGPLLCISRHTVNFKGIPNVCMHCLYHRHESTGERRCMCIFHETVFALSRICKGYLNRFSVSFE